MKEEREKQRQSLFDDIIQQTDEYTNEYRVVVCVCTQAIDEGIKTHMNVRERDKMKEQSNREADNKIRTHGCIPTV